MEKTSQSQEDKSLSNPQELDSEIRGREDRLFVDLDELVREEPGPLAPIDEQIAHTREANRVRREAEAVQKLHSQLDE